ncbi:aspartyl/asparaginyl beta-hydroxylase domain-containing protein [Pleionea litopenaei]|uniref:Aspartyl/asparaginyl beta-hydroxylase domain-containing protein n=1 Tax=Pleionea litopenaei TaxID=3070815 RepID=A0AA51RVH4_9GAMM|nr:aspartyl/asparaginyl beta-hydroxylase domain-containing protein [Pleionea sp. HL-JVS1]WMS88413.1 aspartyl/asparaginyl beta-hydroxylase domain-containing protein [Pleionea sp. HL-JVS1]
MGITVLVIFVICGIYIQNRGKVKHESLLFKVRDHSNILGPINCLFYLFSSVKNTPFLNTQDFAQLKVLEDHWELIRDEALQLTSESRIKASDDLDDIGFNSFFKTGWKRFYIKWYGSDLKSAKQLCPKTVELLSTIPTVKGAMFAMLPPGACLVRHRDPYAGSLRYHLGLSTPNSEDCYIKVDGEKYFWKDGEAVMFDETYLHHAENNTDQNRIILFLDVKRPVSFFLIDWLNTFMSYTLLASTASKNMKGDKVGLLNKLFGGIYKVRLLGKKLKAFNVPLYYVVQYSLYLLLIYWIFLS